MKYVRKDQRLGEKAAKPDSTDFFSAGQLRAYSVLASVMNVWERAAECFSPVSPNSGPYVEK